MLYLEDDDGGRHAELDGTELASLLADQTSLRLVVLNACEGARTTLTDPFAGVATTLVQLGVPAVVAMQFEISDAAAILFAEELYTNLIGRQDPIDAAVAEARKAIYIEQGTVEWATPVLFMGDIDVELFRFEVEAAPLPPPPPPSRPLAAPRRVTPGDAALAPPTPARRSLVTKSSCGVLDAVLALPSVVAFWLGVVGDDRRRGDGRRLRRRSGDRPTGSTAAADGAPAPVARRAA